MGFQSSEYSTPPQLGKRARIAASKIIGWIECGELRGVNLASSTTGRPRYRIAESDWQDFLRRRSGSVVPAPKAPRAKRRHAAVKSFV